MEAGKLAKVTRSKEENLGSLTPGPWLNRHKLHGLLAQYNRNTEGSQAWKGQTGWATRGMKETWELRTSISKVWSINAVPQII